VSTGWAWTERDEVKKHPQCSSAHLIHTTCKSEKNIHNAFTAIVAI